MTLGVGEISYFNSGWNVKYESGAQDNNVTLPYNFVSAKNEKVLFENTVTKDAVFFFRLIRRSGFI